MTNIFRPFTDYFRSQTQTQTKPTYEPVTNVHFSASEIDSLEKKLAEKPIETTHQWQDSPCGQSQMNEFKKALIENSGKNGIANIFAVTMKSNLPGCESLSLTDMVMSRPSGLLHVYHDGVSRPKIYRSEYSTSDDTLHVVFNAV